MVVNGSASSWSGLLSPLEVGLLVLMCISMGLLARILLMKPSKPPSRKRNTNRGGAKETPKPEPHTNETGFVHQVHGANLIRFVRCVGGEDEGDTLLLMRHGERQDHIDKGWAERAAFPDDPPLSTHGRQEAVEVGSFWAKRLQKKGAAAKKFTLSCIITSPMRRCVETAVLFAAATSEQGKRKGTVPIFIDPQLLEFHSRKIFPHGRPKHESFGTKAGQLANLVKNELPSAGPLFTDGDLLPVFPISDGPSEARKNIPFPETEVELEQRVTQTLMYYLHTLRDVAAPQNRDSVSFRILIVTHADVISCAAQCLGDYIKLDKGISPPYCSITTIHRQRRSSSQRAGSTDGGKDQGKCNSWCTSGYGSMIHTKPVLATG